MNIQTRKQRNLLSAIVTLFWFAQYVYIPYQTPFLTSCAVSSSLIGIIVGAYGVSQMLARLPVGVAADCVNRHRSFILIGCLCSGTASLFRCLMPNGTGFLIGNLFSGLASGMWISFMILYTSYYSTDAQQTGTGHVILFNNVGILSGFTAASLLYEKFGMMFLCILSCIAGALATLLSLGLKKPVNSTEKHLSVSSLLSVCKGKRLLTFSALALLQQGIQMSTTMSFTTQVFKNLGADSVVIGISSVFYMLCAVGASAFSSGKLCSKKGPHFWIPLIFFCVAIYCLLVPSVPYIWMLFLLQMIPGLSTGILYTYLTSEAMAGIPKEKKSTAMGCYQAVYALGMTVLPILTGKLVDRFSMLSGFLMLAVLAASGTFFAIFFYRKDTDHV